MNSTADIWITRDSSISEAEWLAYLQSRSDFSVMESAVGRGLDGSAVELGKLYLWEGSDNGAVILSFSAEGIHISPGEESAWALASSLAEFFGATAAEG